MISPRTENLAIDKESVPEVGDLLNTATVHAHGLGGRGGLANAYFVWAWPLTAATVPREDPKRGKKERNLAAGEGKRATFWVVRRRASPKTF